MIDESRFQRLEDKVDVVKEDVSELKTEMKSGLAIMQDHIAGDKKIIDELRPVLVKLPEIVEMAEEHHFSKQLRRKVMKIGAAASLVVGILAGVAKIIG